MTLVATGLVVAISFLPVLALLRVLTPEPIGPYVALHRAQGGPLKERPAGKAALKAELAKAPPSTDLVVIDRPTGASGKRHDPDWKFRTDAWEQVRDSWFADQPDDLAVVRPWVGVGR